MKTKCIEVAAIFAGLLLLAGRVQSQAGTNVKPHRETSAQIPPALPSASPEEEGLSSERLERIAAAIQKSVDDNRIAGGVSLVARHGKVVYFRAVGMADRQAQKPMQTDSVFRLCSMTKPITAAAVMILYEEGRFQLGDPVSNYLPEFKHMKVLDPPWPQDRTSPPGALVDAKRPITILNLLTHTAGLTYQSNPRIGKAYRDAGISGGLLLKDGTIADGVTRLAKQPLLFQPGDAWEYSLADDVLGRLVEVVSGMPFDQFLAQRLFQPLGMKDTYFYLPQEKFSRLVTAYAWDEAKGLRPILDHQVLDGEYGFQYTADYPYAGPRTYFSGGGGLSSTAEDYYRFCQMMLNGGKLNGVRILSRKSIELMSQNHTEGKNDALGYGLGFGVKSDPKQLTELGSLGSYYWGGFYYTTFVIDPKEDMVVIFLGQLYPTGGLNLDFKALTLAYQAIGD